MFPEPINGDPMEEEIVYENKRKRMKLMRDDKKKELEDLLALYQIAKRDEMNPQNFATYGIDYVRRTESGKEHQEIIEQMKKEYRCDKNVE